MKPSNRDAPEADHQTIARFYDQIYYRDADLSHEPSVHLKKLARKLDVRQGESVLDIACGTGEWLSVAHNAGARVSGLDISSRAVAVCKARIPEGTFEVGVAECLPYADASFDLVTCLGSLEHFVDQPAAIREMRRVTKSGGGIVILVPNAGFLTYRFGLYKGTQQQAVRETIRSLGEWGKMFSDVGLRVVDRWKDLHVLDRAWIMRRPWYLIPLRAVQAIALPLWPLGWQYQVYHRCVVEVADPREADLPR